MCINQEYYAHVCRRPREIIYVYERQIIRMHQQVIYECEYIYVEMKPKLITKNSSYSRTLVTIVSHFSCYLDGQTLIFTNRNYEKQKCGQMYLIVGVDLS